MYKMIYDSRHKSCIQSLVGLCLFYRQPIAKLNILHYRNLTTQLCGNLCVNVQCDKHDRRLYYLFGMFKGVAFHGVVSSLQYMVIINIIYIRSVITSYILVVLEVISWTFQSLQRTFHQSHTQIHHSNLKQVSIYLLIISKVC